MEFLKDNDKIILTEFVKFIKKELGIEKLPIIRIQNGKGELVTTANYNYSGEQKIVTINGKNRALIDILRSIGHECAHHKQFEEGRLTDSVKDGSDGSEIENEANAVAGLLIRRFGKQHPELYQL